MVTVVFQREKQISARTPRHYEGTGRLLSRRPTAVEWALLLSSFNSWCCIYITWERAADQRSCTGSAGSQTNRKGLPDLTLRKIWPFLSALATKKQICLFFSVYLLAFLDGLCHSYSSTEYGTFTLKCVVMI